MRLLAFTLSVSAKSNIKAEEANTTIAVCTGPKAAKYHKSTSCRELNRCSGNLVSCELVATKKIYRL